MSNYSLNLAGFGFWIFLAVMVYIAHVQYMAGHDTWVFGHKTAEEKELQRAAIDKAKMEAKAKLQ